MSLMKGQDTNVIKNTRNIGVNAYHLASIGSKAPVITQHYLFDLAILTLLFLHKDLVRTYPNNYYNPLSNQVINLENLASRSLVLSPHRCFSTV